MERLKKKFLKKIFRSMIEFMVINWRIVIMLLMKMKIIVVKN